MGSHAAGKGRGGAVFFFSSPPRPLFFIPKRDFFLITEINSMINIKLLKNQRELKRIKENKYRRHQYEYF